MTRRTNRRKGIIMAEIETKTVDVETPHPGLPVGSLKVVQ